MLFRFLIMKCSRLTWQWPCDASFQARKLDLNFIEKRALYICANWRICIYLCTCICIYIYYVSCITILTFILLQMMMPPFIADSYSIACIHTYIHTYWIEQVFRRPLQIILCRISHEMLRSQLYAKKAMKQRVFRPCAYILKPPLYLKIATLFWPRARRLLPAQCNIPRSPLACLGFEPHPAFKSSLYPPGGMCHSVHFPLG